MEMNDTMSEQSMPHATSPLSFSLTLTQTHSSVVFSPSLAEPRLRGAPAHSFQLHAQRTSEASTAQPGTPLRPGPLAAPGLEPRPPSNELSGLLSMERGCGL
jgi:hypothetical protein